ncbi:hypothetical protein BDQ17DRAFT_1544300 [Cyathus striatus]|nr:hypothetical protein BDQ17DRAFT_1544300 [Cyathus striatus]
MPGVGEVVELACASSFSNGTGHEIKDASITTAGGNINYITINSPNAFNTSSLTLSRVNPDVPAQQSITRSAVSEVLSSLNTSPAQPPIASVEPATTPRSASDPVPETIPGLLGVVASFDGLDNSETTVNLTPSDLPEFLTLSKQQISASSCEVYIKKIFPLRHGFPLWSPQPILRIRNEEHCRRGVSPGDVGIITHRGRFDFLFNILHAAEHPLNPNSLPEDFVPLSLSDDDILILPLYNQEAYLSNMTVKSKMDPSTGDISYNCKSTGKGALLSMPHGAVEKTFTNIKPVRDFIKIHSTSWYKYAVDCGRYIDRHSLCLVTDCIKTDVWGIVTFDEEVAERDGFIKMGKPQAGHDILIFTKNDGSFHTFREQFIG